MSAPLLQVKHLKKTFTYPSKLKVIQDLSLEVYEGDSLAIMGSSGEGKTTLLHILGGLDTFDEGEMFFHKMPLVRKDTKKMGFIFQSYNLLEDFSVWENMLIPLRIARKDVSNHSKAIKKANELLKKVGLNEKKNHPAKLLSGGEKQRCAIARSLINNPSLILADEPTGNLDHENSQKIHQLLISLVKEEKKSIIIATHDQELASLCNKKYQLNNGRLFPINLK